MLRIIITMCVLTMVSVPCGAIAGWGNVLDSAERVDKLIIKRPTPPPSEPTEQEEVGEEAPPPRKSTSRPAPSRGNEDAHFIQSDDYFIGHEELGEHSYIYVDLAKMITPPSSGSKDEGQFMKVHDGQNKWTGHIWQSRIASPHELRLGMHFIAFHNNQNNGVYHAPKKKDSARGGTWWYAKITDMSDTYKGFVTVSGNYKVGLDNIRIPIPYGSQGR